MIGLKGNIGKTFLITSDDWFYAPDGKKYKAVWGTLKAVNDSKDTLGIKTNARSTNWYVCIGNMVLAGCQVHYAIQTDNFNSYRSDDHYYGDTDLKEFTRPTEIYNADEVYES